MESLERKEGRLTEGPPLNPLESIPYRYHYSRDTITSTTPENQMLLPRAHEGVLHITVLPLRTPNPDSQAEESDCPRWHPGCQDMAPGSSICPPWFLEQVVEWTLAPNKAHLTGNSPNKDTQAEQAEEKQIAVMSYWSQWDNTSRSFPEVSCPNLIMKGQRIKGQSHVRRGITCFSLKNCFS